MSRLFGTDGIRGVFGRDLTTELAFGIGRAAVVALAGGGGRPPTFVIGRDTRASGEVLEDALVEGIRTAGGNAIVSGVQPTPAVAFLTADLDASAGVVISASHNPPEYNGIKFFGPSGNKLPDDIESLIEQSLLRKEHPVEPAAVGTLLPLGESQHRYVDHLTQAAEAPLSGMKVIVDCANGAASQVAPVVLRNLGADVEAIFDDPDGENINRDCGALHPEVVAAAVIRSGADAGVAHDGDADRALFSDAAGNVIDGDQVLAACALSMKGEGRLTGDTVVTTVMANLGFHRAMDEAGIDVILAKVGDRYVLEEMLRSGAVLGGEQSGHVIFAEHATTGDGMLTAVRFLSLAAKRGVSLADLAACMRRYPQVLENVRVARGDRLQDASSVWEAVRASETELGDSGRVLVRASGTEPVVRIMVEADSEEDAARHVRVIAERVSAELG